MASMQYPRMAYDLTDVCLLGRREEIMPQFIGTPSERRIRAYLDANRRADDYARELGAKFIETDRPICPEDGASVYRMYPPHWQQPKKWQRLVKTLLQRYTDQIPQVVSVPLSSYILSHNTDQLYKDLEAKQPFVAAYTGFQRGHCKYLIEYPVQLEKLLAAAAHIGSLDPSCRDIANCIDIRPFIDSPSDRYTTWRYVVAAGSGTLLAAGLTYSGHATRESRVIENDRLSDTWGEVTLLKQALELRESDFFLAARDVRSNISSGGGTIPVAGADLAPTTPIEKGILAAHIGDRCKKLLTMKKTAAFIGQVCGPGLDICLAIDTIQDEQTGQELLLEINPSPGASLYNRCNLGGNASDPDALYLQRRQALQCLADFRAGTNRFT